MKPIKEKTVEGIRETLDADIKLQEEELINHASTLEGIRETLLLEVTLRQDINILFQKILRRLSVIYISVGGLLLLGIGGLFYMLNQPMSSIRHLQEDIIEQRRIIEFDRKDVAKARDQFLGVIRVQDSLQRIQDSIIRNHKK